MVGLFAVVGGASLSLVSTMHRREAAAQVDHQLVVTGNVLTSVIRDRCNLLTQASALLSRDHAFQQAYFTDDHATVRSALMSLRQRVGADLMLLCGPEAPYRVVVDTATDSTAATGPFRFPALIDRSSETGLPTSSFIVVDGRLFSVVIVPLLAPDPVAWFCVGFVLDDRFARELGRLTESELAFVQHRPGACPCVISSSLPPGARAPLTTVATASAGSGNMTGATDEHPPAHGARSATEPHLSIGGEPHLALSRWLHAEDGVLLVVHRSLAAALAPFEKMQYFLLLIAAAGFLAAVAGAFGVARRVSRPVSDLVAGAREIATGQFGRLVTIEQEDEIGELARAFNGMSVGLAERDRIRDLLGKVVSSAIADELLRTDEIKLGGEEREATILFSDIRSFTTLCEGRTPSDVLALLNHYLTGMNRVIEEHGGVVDKFIGDAIMALYGAPVRHDDDVDRALRSALAMQAELTAINAEFGARGWPTIKTGIGINTDVVVAGNMGSSNRLNYTVIGDGVNLASRLESLCKEYRQTIIVSEPTLKKARGTYRTEPLGEVVVKGKTEPTRIHALLGM